MPILNKTIPEYIVDIVFSEEYIDFCHALERDFSLSEEQMTLIDDILTSLFEKTLSSAEFAVELKRKLGLDEEKTKEISRRLFLNIVLVFSAYFGDFSELYQKEFGSDPDKDLLASSLYRVLLRDMNAALKKKADEILSFDWEQQSKDMIELFQKNLLEQFYAPDGLYKVSLNNTIFALFNTVDDYNLKLLDAMYKNEQEIGDQSLVLTGGSKQKPSVVNWIKDFLSFSGGVVSSIEIAKYLSQNKNVVTLSQNDRDALRRLLETFSVLKNFPESFEKMTLDTWKVIPYYIPGEEASTRERVKGSGTDFAVAKTEPDPNAKLSQTPTEPDPTTQIPPTPTITIVEAPEPQAHTLVGEPMAKPVLPLKTDARSAEKGSGTDLGERGQAQILRPQKLSQTPTEPDPKLSQTPTVQKIDFSAGAEAVLAKTGVAIVEDYRERVKNIIVTRLRNIRNAIDAKERLCAPTAEGGAGLLPEDAEKLLQEANTAINAIADGTLVEYVPPPMKTESEKGSGTVQERGQAQGKGSGTDFAVAKTEPDPSAKLSQTPTEPDPMFDPAQAPKLVIKEVGGVPMIVEKVEKKTNGKKKEDKAPEKTTELTTEKSVSGTDSEWGQAQILVTGSGTDFAVAKTEPDPMSQTPTEPDPALPPVLVPAHLEDAKDIPVVVTTIEKGSGTDFAVAKTEPDPKPDPTAVGAGKKPIPDVKALPRLVGPIDELRALTIKDIRRISEDPLIATQKIAEKINALGKESLSKKAEAINAWKESPVYQLYLTVGQMNLGKDMDNLMEERKAAGKEYLNAKEFDALLDLNEKLRF